MVQHTIDVQGHPPIKSRPYRVADSQRSIINQHIEKMLADQVIEPSVSPWSSPVVIVKKKDGSDRFCIDFRAVNRITKKDNYPLPRCDDIFDRLGSASYFSTLDMMSGYWQVGMSEADKEKTAFITYSGLYQWLVMPFGLCNAPSTYQRLMEHVLRGLLYLICVVFIDDVLIFSATFNDHLKHLKLVFDRLRQHNLKLKLKKCDFMKTSVNYLGHVVSNKGLQPDPSKIEKIKNYPAPTSVTELKRFLGLASYYRRFIARFSKIAGPLHKLLKKDTAFNWSAECERTFCALKEKLISSPVLAFPDFTRPFFLHTDASGTGVGALLSQDNDGCLKPIAFASRSLTPAESRYPVIEQEALAMIFGLQYFRTYIYGKPFTIATDHRPLKWLIENQQNSSRLIRWGLLLQEYDVKIVYTPGKENRVADALSRLPSAKVGAVLTRAKTKQANVPAAPKIQPTNAPSNSDSAVARPVPALNVTYKPLVNSAPEFRKLQTSDPLIKDIISSKLQDPASYPMFELDDNILFRQKNNRSLLVLPRNLTSDVMKACHDDLFGSHLGFNKTLKKIQLRYFWPRMFSDIKAWVQSCPSCQTKKGSISGKKVPLHPIPVEGPFDRIAIDCLGPLPISDSGNKHIVVICEYLTKWTEAFAVKDITAKTIADLLLTQIVCRHGAPKVLLSDQGTNFMSEIIEEVCKLLDTKKVKTSPYHPATDGLVEKFNNTLATMLSMYVNSKQSDWDIYLPYCIFAYNTSVQSSTSESPFYLLYGRDPFLPSDIALSRILPTKSVMTCPETISERLSFAWDLAREHIQKAQDNQKKYYDRKAKPHKFCVGERVLLYRKVLQKGRTKKLSHFWRGPFRIVELSHTNAVLRSCDRPKGPTFTVNVTHLKPFYGPYVPCSAVAQINC